MPLTILTAVWTWVSSKLSFKGICIFIALCLLAYGGWRGYDYILDKGKALGVASQQDAIGKLNATITQDKKDIAMAQAAEALAKSQLASYVDSYDKYVKEMAENNAKLKAEQDTIVAGLNGKITTLNKQLASAQSELTHAIPTLIPTGTPDVSGGLIVLYNAALAGSDSTGGFPAAVSVGANASYSPSVPADTAAGYFIHNGLACYQNRETVILWQSWYTGNKAVIDAAIAAQKATPVPTTGVSGKNSENPAQGSKGAQATSGNASTGKANVPATPPTDTKPGH